MAQRRKLLALALLVGAFVYPAGGQEPVPAYPSTGYPTTAAPPLPTSYADLLAPVTAGPIAEAVTPVPAPPVEAAVTSADAVLAEVAADAAAVADAAIEEVVEPTRWYYPSYWFGPTPWDSGIEFGLNGASGTSESISYRAGGYVKRKADDYKFNGSLYYNNTKAEGTLQQSNALLDVRYDWLFDNSPWTLFILNQSFYDEFAAFDFNTNLNTGFGYQWLDEDWTKLTTSIGAGASREFGNEDTAGNSLNDEWVAEASFGVNYELNWADNKKFYAKIDWFPQWEDFGNYRALADIGFEFELHKPTNMSLKLSATDRYDSQPQGAEPHNLNYSSMLIWKL
ncbi:MAG: DUF481 domain-containing protein [Planctomycetota bacterium]